MKYVATDFYCTRIPILPFDKNSIVCKNTDMLTIIKDILTNKEFLAALYIASPELTSALKRIQSGNIPKQSEVNHIVYSIEKYFNRATTRTTPFGLFTGVGIGSFGTHTELMFDANTCYHQHCRADMQWLMLVVKEIEIDKISVYNLKYRVNDSCYIAGNRIMNPHFAVKERNEDQPYTNISLKYTIPLQIIIDSFRNQYFCFQDAKKSIIEKYPNISDEKLTTFIIQLIDNEILLSELRPPLYNCDPLKYILSILDLRNFKAPYREKLSEVFSLISDINSTSSSRCEMEYDNCISLMQEIKKYSNKYLQVDLGQSYEQNMLCKPVKDEIERIVSLIITITRNYVVNPFLDEYRKKFIAQYGYYKEVPIMQLLDQTIGLGTPFDIKGDKLRGLSETFEKSLTKLLQDKLHLSSNATEIILTEDDLLALVKVKEENKLFPASVEFAFYLSAKSKTNIDRGIFNIIVSPMIGANEALKSLGRFSHYLSKEQQINFLEVQSSKVTLHSNRGQMLVEGHEVPQFNRLGNLCQNISNQPYHLSVGTNNHTDDYSVTLDDIYIGLDPETQEFYIKSLAYNKKIKISNLNMINMRNYSNAFRFLSEISDGVSNAIFYFFNCLSDFGGTCRPRIVLGKTILTTACWRLSYESIDMNSVTQFCEAFNVWLTYWNVPQFVFWGESDRRLYIDITSAYYQEKVYDYLLNHHNEIEFSEGFGDMETLWVTDHGGNKYLPEYVVPLIGTRQFCNEKVLINRCPQIETVSDISSNEKKTTIDAECRNLLPGQQNWWYYKLYLKHIHVLDLISEINNFCNELIRKQVIDKYFFIRYSDPDFHIRLRMHVIDGLYYSIFIPEMVKWLQYLSNQQLINKSAIDTYVREIERYGGEYCIECAEHCFFYDSTVIVKVFDFFKLQETSTIDRNLFAVHIICRMFRTFGLGIKEQFDLLRDSFSVKYYRKIYRKQDKLYMLAASHKEETDFLSRLNLSDEIFELITLRDNYIGLYWKEIAQKDQEGLLTNTKKDIIFSMIHMFCNRYGESVEWEQFIMHMTRNSIYDLSQKEKIQD